MKDFRDKLCSGVIQGLVLERKACQCVLENSLKSTIYPSNSILKKYCGKFVDFNLAKKPVLKIIITQILVIFLHQVRFKLDSDPAQNLFKCKILFVYNIKKIIYLFLFLVSFIALYHKKKARICPWILAWDVPSFLMPRPAMQLYHPFICIVCGPLDSLTIRLSSSFSSNSSSSASIFKEAPIWKFLPLKKCICKKKYILKANFSLHYQRDWE